MSWLFYQRSFSVVSVQIVLLLCACQGNNSGTDLSQIQIDNMLNSARELLKSNVDLSGKYATIALEMSESIGDDHRTIESKIALGSYHSESGVHPLLADSLYNDALTSAKELNDSSLLNSIYNNLGVRSDITGKFDQALMHYRRALDFDPKLRDTTQRINTLRNIGIVYDHLNLIDQAEKYFLESIVLAESSHDQFSVAEGLNSLAIANYRRGRFLEGLEFSRKAILLYRDTETLEGLLNAMNNLSLAFLRIGEIDSVSHIWSDLVHQADKSQNYRLKMRSQAIWGNILIDQKEYTSAIQAFIEAEQLAKKISDVDFEKQMHWRLAQTYKLIDNDGLAYDYLLKHKEVEDAVLNQKVLSRIADYEVLYQTEKKEKMIAEQALVISNRTRYRNLLLTALPLLTAIFLLVIFHNKSMSEKKSAAYVEHLKLLEKENKILNMDSMLHGQEEERRRVAKDLHDGLGSLLATVKGHFLAIQHEVDRLMEVNIYKKTNDLINMACEEVRRISHDMMPQSLMEDGLRGAILDLISNYKTHHDIRVEMDIQGFLDRLDTKLEIMLFRIFQELLLNVDKHAQATRLFIQLIVQRDYLHITFEDDGRGFDLNNYQNGLGLQSIRSRVAYLDGEINIDPVLGRGTTIIMDIPINKFNDEPN